jgi:hypothetical protein
MTTQEYFKALNNSDARMAVLSAYNERLEAEMLPMIMSIAMTKDEPEVIIDKSGIHWHVVGTI